MFSFISSSSFATHNTNQCLQKSFFSPFFCPSYTKPEKRVIHIDVVNNKVIVPENKTNVGSDCDVRIIFRNLKEDWPDFRRVLDENNVRYLYHFTDERNIPGIIKNGGLFSWFYCSQNNIEIPYPGGNQISRELDKYYDLQDYVRLSFCNDHPMQYRLQQSGSNVALLKISTDVALLRSTMFSDRNAADSGHNHGGTLADLQRVDFRATQRNYVRADDTDFKPHQAEVMVKTFIPKEYILNLDEFEL